MEYQVQGDLQSQGKCHIASGPGLIFRYDGCCWYQLDPIVSMQDFLESPEMLPQQFQS